MNTGFILLTGLLLTSSFNLAAQIPWFSSNPKNGCWPVTARTRMVNNSKSAIPTFIKMEQINFTEDKTNIAYTAENGLSLIENKNSEHLKVFFDLAFARDDAYLFALILDQISTNHDSITFLQEQPYWAELLKMHNPAVITKIMRTIRPDLVTAVSPSKVSELAW